MDWSILSAAEASVRPWFFQVGIAVLGVAIPLGLTIWAFRYFRKSTASVNTQGRVKWQDQSHVILTVKIENRSRISIERIPGNAVVWIREYKEPPHAGQFYSDLFAFPSKHSHHHLNAGFLHEENQEVMTTKGILEPHQSTCVDVLYTRKHSRSWLHVLFKFECPLTPTAARQRGQDTDSFATTIWVHPFTTGTTKHGGV